LYDIVTAAETHDFVLALCELQPNLAHPSITLLHYAADVDDLDGVDELGVLVHGFVDLAKSALPDFLVDAVFANIAVAYVLRHGDEFLVGKVQSMVSYLLGHKSIFVKYKYRSHV